MIPAGLAILALEFDECGRRPVPVVGEISSFGGLALRVYGAGVAGLLVGKIVGMALTRNANRKNTPHDAFLATFVQTAQPTGAIL